VCPPQIPGHQRAAPASQSAHSSLDSSLEICTYRAERTLGEVKRRTKVIGRFPGEEGWLSLVSTVIDLQINNAYNAVKVSEIDRQPLPASLPAPGESEAERKEVIAA
jgi:hypothetical protein